MGADGGRRKKKNPSSKKYGIIRSQSTLTCWGTPFPLHFKPLLLRFSTIATTSLPVYSGYPVSQLAAGGRAGGFPPFVIQSPRGMCCIVRGESSQRYSAHYSPSRAITHSQYPPGSEENIDQRSLFPHPGYRLGKNKIITIQLS